MTTRVNNNGITTLRTLPKRVLPRLKNVKSINSFDIGKQTLGPLITKLFKAQGKELNDIHLDNIAKVRLLGMGPSLKERVEAEEKIEEVLTGDPLELSLFITEDQYLYILGNKQNISTLKRLSEETKTAVKDGAWRPKDQNEILADMDAYLNFGKKSPQPKPSPPPQTEGPQKTAPAPKISNYRTRKLDEEIDQQPLWVFNELQIDPTITDSEELEIVNFLSKQYLRNVGELYVIWPFSLPSKGFIRITKLEGMKYRIDVRAPEDIDGEFKDYSFTLGLERDKQIPIKIISSEPNRILFELPEAPKEPIVEIEGKQLKYIVPGSGGIGGSIPKFFNLADKDVFSKLKKSTGIDFRPILKQLGRLPDS